MGPGIFFSYLPLAVFLFFGLRLYLYFLASDVDLDVDLVDIDLVVDLVDIDLDVDLVDVDLEVDLVNVDLDYTSVNQQI